MTRSRDLLTRRSKSELLVAGVKVATQTPPIRSGRRVVFLTLDDATGPVDATFFEDAQGPYAATRLPLLAAGRPRRAAPHRLPRRLAAGHRLLGAAGARRALAARGHRGGARGDGRRPRGRSAGSGVDDAVPGAAESRVHPAGDGPARPSWRRRAGAGHDTAGGMGRRRVLVHSSGFQMSPYADIKPAGEDTKDVARKLWHRSPGSPG